VRYLGQPPRGPRRVTVPGRQDIGEVVNEGTNIGTPDKNIYCVAVHFPETGEIVYYDKSRVTTVTEPAP
jgi:hypothetical protein